MSPTEEMVLSLFWHRFPCGAYFCQLMQASHLPRAELGQVLRSLLLQEFIEKRGRHDGFRKHCIYGTCAADGSNSWAGLGHDKEGFSPEIVQHIHLTVEYFKNNCHAPCDTTNDKKPANPNLSSTKPKAEWAKAKKDAYEYFGDLGPQVKAAKHLKSRGVKIKKTTLIAELIRLSDEKFPGSRTGVERWKEIVRMTPIHQALKHSRGANES